MRWLTILPVAALAVSLTQPAHAQPLIRGLGQLGATDRTIGTGISADGNVVIGFSIPSGGPPGTNRSPVRWVLDSGGQIQNFGQPQGLPDGMTLGVSANGNGVLGYGFQGPSTHDFRWTGPAGPSTLLNTPGGWLSTRARAISPDGVTVVGTATIPSLGASRATRWVGLVEGAPIPLPAGLTSSGAYCFDGAFDRAARSDRALVGGRSVARNAG